MSTHSTKSIRRTVAVKWSAVTARHARVCSPTAFPGAVGYRRMAELVEPRLPNRSLRPSITHSDKKGSVLLRLLFSRSYQGRSAGFAPPVLPTPSATVRDPSRCRVPDGGPLLGRSGRATDHLLSPKLGFGVLDGTPDSRVNGSRFWEGTPFQIGPFVRPGVDRGLRRCLPCGNSGALSCPSKIAQWKRGGTPDLSGGPGGANTSPDCALSRWHATACRQCCLPEVLQHKHSREAS